jgi:hypothetical protein
MFEFPEDLTRAIRQFQYDYIYIDAIFLALWIIWLLREGRRTALLAGGVFGFFTYVIDAVFWWNLPAGDNYPPGTFIRQYWIDAQPVPHTFGRLLILKAGADFMMTISYGLFVFTFVWLIFDFWKGVITRKKILEYAMFWATSWLLTPWLSIWLPIDNTLVVSVRNMDTQVVLWIINLIAGYGLLSVVMFTGKFGSKQRPNRWFGVFFLGLYVSFMMEFPLMLAGIRPYNILFLVYETVFLFNQGAPYLWIMANRLFPTIKSHLTQGKNALK